MKNETQSQTATAMRAQEHMNGSTGVDPEEQRRVIALAPRTGFCVFIDTLAQGPVPIFSLDDHYEVFETELEAQKEIVDSLMDHLQQFLDGERDFDDAINVEEYVVPVTVYPDGTFTDEAGRRFDLKVK